MKPRNILIVAAIFTLTTTLCRADEHRSTGFVTGTQLAQLAKDYDKFLDTSTASYADEESGFQFVGYVEGTFDALEEAARHSHRSLGYHVPARVTAEQLAAVVSKYLKDHPGKGNRDAALLVKHALVDAFPVRTTRSAKPAPGAAQ